MTTAQLTPANMTPIKEASTHLCETILRSMCKGSDITIEHVSELMLSLIDGRSDADRAYLLTTAKITLAKLEELIKEGDRICP